MKISSKTDYALRTVVDLATYGRKDVVRIADIAARQNIPRKFLEQILLILKGAGIAQSRRGAHGGYLLGRDSSEISLASIIALTDASLISTPKPASTSAANPPLSSAMQEIWEGLGDYVSAQLRQQTVADLCKRTEELSSEAAPQYSI